MPPLEPPDPVTILYVGTWTGLVGFVLRALKELLPKRWRAKVVPAILVLIVAAGLNALVVWCRALLGGLPQAGAFMPRGADALAYVSGIAGLFVLAAIPFGLWLRYGRPKRVIDLDRFVTISGGLGVALGVLARLALD